jgi:hypothetical protein
MDLTYIKKFTPYCNYSEIAKIDFENEIKLLSNEMEDINIKSLPFDKWDYLVVLLAGVCGGLIDVFLGKPGGYAEPKIKNDSFFGLGQKLKDFNIDNNPIDRHIPGAYGGNHRLFSYGHDLFRFFKGVKLILGQTDEIGIAGTGGILSGNFSNFNSPDSIWKAILILAIHLYKDFWTCRSLPIPGSTIIANLNNDKMPQIIDELTNNREVNLRQLSGQLLSVTVVELIIRIYTFFKYYNSEISKDQINHKRNKMLLLGHSTAMLFNVGKIIVTENPFFLNWAQLIRIIILSWKVVKENTELNHKAIIKTDLSVLKIKLETLETVIILDKSIYYTNQVDKFIIEQKKLIHYNLDIATNQRINHITALRDKIK